MISQADFDDLIKDLTDSSQYWKVRVVKDLYEELHIARALIINVIEEGNDAYGWEPLSNKIIRRLESFINAKP